jgi:NAD(P)-dependent dehydrogenase (short-subunit alcohol dehydrogenase family)
MSSRSPATATGPAATATAALARAVDATVEATVVASFSRIGPAVRSRLFHWAPPAPDALAGRVAIVTGATSGIGAALAEGLVDIGATVHVVGRDPDKLRSTTDALARRRPGANPTASVVGHLADLADQDQVVALADELCALDRVDVLAHVAGALVHERHLGANGVETTTQVHVVSPFLLTARLLPALAEHAGRVITVSSGGMYTQRLDRDDLLSTEGPFDGTEAYARAKRAQVELNAEWAARFPDLGVGFHAMHPGWVDTPGLDAGLPGFARVMRPLLRTRAQGADTARWLAYAPEASAPGGDFWLDRRTRHTVAVPWTRTPAGEADRVWDAIRDRAGVDPERTAPDHRGSAPRRGETS